jgi:hypothetical protein
LESILRESRDQVSLSEPRPFATLDRGGFVRTLFNVMAVLAAVTAGACSETRTPTSPTPPTPACSFTLSTTTLSMAGTGGSASLGVVASTGCAWSVTSNAPFVSITSANNQSGNGTVNITVPENPGDARTGTLTIAGQTVTITQAAGDQLYGNWAGTITKGAGCPASLPASVAFSGTIRRTSAATSEFVISIPALGISNTPIPLIVNGNSLQLFVPIDTLYTFTATLSSDRRSLAGTFSGGTCSGTWAGTRQ